MKRLLSLSLVLLLFSGLCACAACEAPPAAPEQSTVQETGEYPRTLTDSLGNTILLDKMPQRVAVLLGSYAECWVLAGGEAQLAAVTRDAFDERGLELDASVIDLGESHQPNLEALFAAAPDLVILTPDLEGQLALADSLAHAGIPAAWIKMEAFSDYLTVLQIFTSITGREDCYQKYGLEVETQVERAVASVPDKGPDVLLLRAYSSNVKAKNSDNTAGMMLRDLGCRNIADSDSGLLEQLQMEAILAADPQYIFVTTMGSDTEKALQSLQTLFDSDPAWQSLTAVKEGRIHVLDKKLFHYKPNARWGESYEILAEILYPET